MNREAIVLAVENRGVSPAVFADAMVEAKAIRIEGQQEHSEMTAHMWLGGVLGGAATIGAAAVGSILAPISGVAMVATIGYALGEYMQKTAPRMQRAKEVEILLADATSDEWAALAGACGTPEDLSGCLRAGLLESHRRNITKGTLYHAALAHAHGLGKVLPSEYEPITKTGFARPKATLSWREQRIAALAPATDATAETVAQSKEATAAEVDILGRKAMAAAGYGQISQQLASTVSHSPAAALHLIFTKGGATDRDLVGEGITVARLHELRVWAKENATAIPTTASKAVKPTFHQQPTPIVVPMVEAVVIPDVAPAPTAQSVVKPVVTVDVLADVVSDAPSPQWIVGPSQGGKSALSGTIAQRLIEQKYDIWFINLLCTEVSPVEAVASRSVTCDLNNDSVPLQRAAIEAATALLKQLRSAEDVVLVFDEFTALLLSGNPLLAVIKDTITETVNETRNSGPKRSQGILAIGTPFDRKSLAKDVQPIERSFTILPLLASATHGPRGVGRPSVADVEATIALSTISIEALSEDTRQLGLRGQYHGISHLNTFAPRIRPAKAQPIAQSVAMPVAQSVAARPTAIGGFSIGSMAATFDDAWDDAEVAIVGGSDVVRAQAPSYSQTVNKAKVQTTDNSFGYAEEF